MAVHLPPRLWGHERLGLPDAPGGAAGREGWRGWIATCTTRTGRNARRQCTSCAGGRADIEAWAERHQAALIADATRAQGQADQARPRRLEQLQLKPALGGHRL